MDRNALRETESLTRSIARWGSLVAALIFGATFLGDENRTWPLYEEQGLQVAMIGLVFVGYALAWTKRFEALGSVVAVAATVVAYFVCFSDNLGSMRHLSFLFVGVPALVHLVAVATHYARWLRATH